MTQLVAEPGQVARGDLKDLHALAEQYPWFAGAQLLRTIGEQRAGDIRSEESLHTAAVHIPSRSVLFDLVTNPGTENMAPLTVVRKEDKEVDSAAKDEPVVELHPHPSKEEPIDAVLLQPRPDPVQEIPEPTSTAPDPLELQIMESARASAYDLTWDTILSEQPDTTLSAVSAEDHLYSAGLEQPPTAGIVVLVEEEAKPIPEAEQVKEVTPTRVDPRSTRLRFTDWLDQDLGRIHDTEASVAAPLEQRVEDQQPATTELRAAVAVVPALPKEPFGTKDLIDRFIQQQNPAAPTKVAFYTPQQAAKRSLDDSAGLVTETLARIYAKQGNLPKAIDAYQRLAIKYPAKSAYFATLAKELEGQLNR